MEDFYFFHIPLYSAPVLFTPEEELCLREKIRFATFMFQVILNLMKHFWFYVLFFTAKLLTLKKNHFKQKWATHIE